MLGDEAIRNNDGASGVAVDDELPFPHGNGPEDRVAGVQGHGDAGIGGESRAQASASVDELDGDASACWPRTLDPLDRSDVGD